MEIPFSQKINLFPNHVRQYLIDIDKIIRKYIGYSNIFSLILFGSYVKGEYTTNSDCDLLVILKDKFCLNKPKSFFKKMESYFLTLEQKNNLKLKRKNLIDEILIVIEKSTGMFTSHFITKQSSWEKRKFYKIFKVNRVLATLLAPGDIVLKNMEESFLVLYGDKLDHNRIEYIGFIQILKSLIMNLCISISAIVINPLWKKSLKYSLESFKWCVRNSNVYLFNKNHSIKDMINFFIKINVKKEMLLRFSMLRRKFREDIKFLICAPFYIVKIHLLTIKYRKIIRGNEILLINKSK